MAKASETLQLLRDEWLDECYNRIHADNGASRQAVEIVIQMLNNALERAIHQAEREEAEEKK